MHEYYDFVVPVNMLTLSVSAPFSWAIRHTTECLNPTVYFQKKVVPV